jgi:hypothetical protein
METLCPHPMVVGGPPLQGVTVTWGPSSSITNSRGAADDPHEADSSAKHARTIPETRRAGLSTVSNKYQVPRPVIHKS